jgi:type IV secretory pathway VirB2 component (pilin)
MNERNVLISALTMLQHMLLGPVAVSIAVVVIGGLGYLTMFGRLDRRDAIRLLLGCFAIFGASSIAAGILRAMDLTRVQPDVPLAKGWP